MPKVTFEKTNKTVEVENAMRLIDICTDNNFPVIFGCGGNGRCGSCIVKVTKGAENISNPMPRERNKLRDVGRSYLTHRYACMCRVKGDITISV